MRSQRPVTRFDITSEINVTPMIDVMLVLLIIFMVVTPVMLALPSAATAAPEREQRITLTLNAAGSLSLDAAGKTQPLALAELPARLATLYGARPQDHVLYLKADRSVPYAQVLSVMEAARHAGVRRIGAITSPPAHAQPHPSTRQGA